MAEIVVGVELGGGRSERDLLVGELELKGYPVLDMTDNDTAKLHVRHMIGGHASMRQPDQLPERLYRFRFPERPGALLGFLSSMEEEWNITLFHYRNHGAAYARVLVGMQIPDSSGQKFQQFLDELGFAYEDETENKAYKRFLL